MLESADLVVGLCAEHRDAATKLAPAAKGRTFTLKELVYLLEATAPRENGSEPDTSLGDAVRAAGDRRASDPDLPLADQDVQDPLGLGLESYQVTAWEIEDLSRRLVDGLFPRDEEPT